MATRRHEEGTWLHVGRVRAESPARLSGLREEDLVLRYGEINKGTWHHVGRVHAESPAGLSGLREEDLVLM